MYGTSLGVQLASGDLMDAGHEHHLRAITRVRRAGGIRDEIILAEHHAFGLSRRPRRVNDGAQRIRL